MSKTAETLPAHHTYCKCDGNFERCCDNPSNYPQSKTPPKEGEDYESGLGKNYEYMEERMDCSDSEEDFIAAHKKEEDKEESDEEESDDEYHVVKLRKYGIWKFYM